MSEPSRAWQIAQAAACMGVCIGLGRFTVGLVLPSMKEDLAVSYVVAGLMASANLGAYLLGVGAMTRLGRRVPHHRLLRVALLVAAVSFAALAVPLDDRRAAVAVAVVALAAAGFAGALGWISVAALGTALAAGHRRGRVLGVIGSAVGVGMILASGAAAALSPGGDLRWRQLWAIEAVVALACWAAVRPRPSLAAAAPPGRRERAGMPMLYLAYSAFGVGYALFATYFVAAAAGEGASVARATTLWALVGVGAMFGALGYGVWSDRAGRRLVLVATQLFGVVACLAVAAASEGATVLGAMGGVILGSIMTGMASLVPAALADVLPLRRVGEVFAAMTFVFAIVQAATPPIGGVVIDHAGGFPVAFGIGAASFVVAAAAFAVALAGGQAASAAASPATSRADRAGGTGS